MMLAVPTRCQCMTSSIKLQALPAPTPFQINFTVTIPVTILSFMMNQDTEGIDKNNPMKCGIKSYSTGLTWLTVLAPSDPLTQNFMLQVTTNDYHLATTYSVNLVVTFANSAFPSTITQNLSVTLLHPCKTTVITTS